MKNHKQNCKKKKVKRQGLRIVHPFAAGIDVGSRKHYVAIPSECGDQTVRHFGCMTPDLHEMAKWLKQNRVDTVAMESTGVYWIAVAQILDQYGIEVNLVDARAVKNVPGRKSDVQDCQWLQELHSFGLLRAAFRPTNDMAVLRSYWRHRKELVKAAAEQIHLMQKSLELMNLQLHKAISDITGVTGMKIIRAIVSGQRDPLALAKMRHRSIKSSEETIVKALTGDWREEHLFTLEQALEAYDFYHRQIASCDQRIERYMKTFPSKGDVNDKGDRSRRRKNQVHFDLRSELHRITGVDLTTIDAIDVLTAQTVISECGYDMSRFPTEKNFSSWLGLSPNNVITGGKVRRRGTRKVYNRAAHALRLAAQSLHRSKTALGAYYRRMKGRLGPPKAITATARKLAILIYRMLKYGTEYVDRGQQAYEQQYQERLLQSLRKHARQMGYEIVNIQSGEVVS
jgi:transposase